MKNDVILKIQERLPKLSKGQKLIACYILEHYDKAIYLTAAKLGGIVGVSESTVVRFAYELGYDGYPKFQNALEELVKNKLTTMQRLEVTTDRIDKTNILKSVLQMDEDRIKRTREQVDEEIFNEAVEKILTAKNIYIIGVRSCSGLATFLGYYLNIIFDNVKTVDTNSISDMFESIYKIGKGDVIIGISFPRYSRATMKCLEYAQKNEADVIAITDSYISPITSYAQYPLIGCSEMLSFADSLVAPLSIINALIVALSLKKKDEIVTNLEKLENIWGEYQVYNEKELLKDGKKFEE